MADNQPPSTSISNTESTGWTAGRWALAFIFGTIFVVVGTAVLYVLITDGSPFRAELLTPWQVVSLVDLYAAFLMFYVWLVYKEQGWVSRILWLVAVVCTGSVAIAAYVFMQVVTLEAGRPAWHILVREMPKSRQASASKDRV